MVILYAWLLADFLTGIVHWAQDKLLLRETGVRFLDRVKLDNDLHHAKPAQLTRYTLWQNMNTSAIAAWPAALGLFLIGAPTVLWLAAILGSFANIVHRYAHTPRARIPRWIRFMQWTGLFISGSHHNQHHFDSNGLVRKEDSTGKYCPMSNWLNPILDHSRFFLGLERILLRKR